MLTLKVCWHDAHYSACLPMQLTVFTTPLALYLRLHMVSRMHQDFCRLRC